MKIEYLPEPELEFGDSRRHVDIRFGLMQHGPLDYSTATAPKDIRVGIVGSAQSAEGFHDWLERCRDEIPARESKQPHLFPRFPGCNPQESFRTTLVATSEFQRSFSPVALQRASKSRQVIQETIELFLAEFDYLQEHTKPDVLVCALPVELLNAMEAINAEGNKDRASNPDFHDLLKAKSMRLNVPIQIVLPGTYDATMLRKQKRNPDRARTLQDEATRAWNIHTALYYKAGGVPWRLIRDPSQHTTCYVGISFYKSLDGSLVLTSVAQVFNQLGEGVIVRGGAARITKEDRQIHLGKVDAYRLLKNALQKYRETHKTMPARVVVHKSTIFDEAEIDGCAEAIEELNIEMLDLVSIGDTDTKLFRLGAYPPLRGTFLNLDAATHLLYTRGSVYFFETYPGSYVPAPHILRCAMTTQTPKAIAQEILALSKMNWNKTQFDGSEPITLWAARQVSAILKYMDEEPTPNARYAFYM